MGRDKILVRGGFVKILAGGGDPLPAPLPTRGNPAIAHNNNDIASFDIILSLFVKDVFITKVNKILAGILTFIQIIKEKPILLCRQILHMGDFV